MLYVVSCVNVVAEQRSM